MRRAEGDGSRLMRQRELLRFRPFAVLPSVDEQSTLATSDEGGAESWDAWAAFGCARRSGFGRRERLDGGVEGEDAGLAFSLRQNGLDGEGVQVAEGDVALCSPVSSPLQSESRPRAPARATRLLVSLMTANCSTVFFANVLE